LLQFCRTYTDHKTIMIALIYVKNTIITAKAIFTLFAMMKSFNIKTRCSNDFVSNFALLSTGY